MPMNTAQKPNQQGGFTLIEVMIVVAIIGILTAIALPAYTDYVRRGRISDATTTLSNLRIKMEQYYQDRRDYGAGACGVVEPNHTYFNFNCVSGGPTFTYTATGTGPMANFNYTIDEAGNQASTIGVAGWSGNPNCWAIRKDGSCQ